jgi:hypothetical protein
MDSNEKELLEKTYEMVKENNNILKSIRNSNRWSALFRVFYWIIIIGISIGAFYYIQPYVDVAIKTYKSLQGDLKNVKSVVNTLPVSINKTN